MRMGPAARRRLGRGLARAAVAVLPVVLAPPAAGAGAGAEEDELVARAEALLAELGAVGGADRPVGPAAAVAFVDPSGDTAPGADCRADIVAFAVDHGASSVRVSAQTACPTDPTTDAAWEAGGATLVWLLDTTADGAFDHAVLFGVVDGTPTAVVARYGLDLELTTTCAPRPAEWAAASGHAVTFEPACIGRPRSIRLAAVLEVGQVRDSAPDVGLSSPVDAPAPPALAPLADGPATASAHPGQLDVFARGGDDALWFRHFERTWGPWGAWQPWRSLGGRITSAPAVLSTATGQLDVFARGGDGALWTRHFDGSAWGGWRSLGGALTSAPSAASAAAGTLDVFGRGRDGALGTRRLDGATWGAWRTLGGSATSSPAAVSPGPGLLAAFVRGGDGALWTRRFDGSAWSSWQTLGGGLASGPGAIATSAGAVEVFVRGGDGALWTRRDDGGAWGPWSSIGGAVSSAPSVAEPVAGELHLVVRGLDAAVWVRHRTTEWSSWGSVGGRVK